MILEKIRQNFPKFRHKQKKNMGPDMASFRCLVKKHIDQSQCIRLGIELENLFRDFILDNCEEWIHIKENLVAQKQCDHLFFNTKKKDDCLCGTQMQPKP